MLDTHRLKSMAGEDILVTRSIQVETKHINANEICNVMGFLIDNIFVKFGGYLFLQVIGLPMGTNCHPPR